MQKLNNEEIIEVVKRNGYALEFIQDQTPQICMEAVKEEPYALKYVRKN